MAAGDLITRDGQYEFNGVLFNDAADGDALKVTSVEGLFDLPAFKSVETELQDDHGGFVSRQLLTMRRVVMEIQLLATSKTNMQTKARSVVQALQPYPDPLPLVFQRALLGKQLVNARVSRFSGFTSVWDKEFGLAVGTIEFVCPDPRKLALVQSSQPVVIASGATSASATATMLGNFRGGAKPILEIAGPTTNPRIGNAGDGGRGIRIDVVINAGSLLVVDARDRSVKLDGLDAAANVRTDNQWWILAPGANLITFTRSNTPANTSTLTVKWWDSDV